MKKRITSIFLTLALVLSLTGTALAAVTVNPVSPSGKTVTATLGGNDEYIDLTVSGLTSGSQYLVLMVSGIVEKPEDAQITESTIKYIDQASADGTLKVSFKVYPNGMQNSTILLSGSDVPLTIVATVEVPYKLGDANLDGNRNIQDITVIAKHIAGVEVLEDINRAAADANSDNNINIQDLTALAKHIAGSELLP